MVCSYCYKYDNYKQAYLPATFTATWTSCLIFNILCKFLMFFSFKLGISNNFIANALLVFSYSRCLDNFDIFLRHSVCWICVRQWSSVVDCQNNKITAKCQQFTGGQSCHYRYHSCSPGHTLPILRGYDTTLGYAGIYVQIMPFCTEHLC